MMVSLDQAMSEGEICPARIKEALWGVYVPGMYMVDQFLTETLASLFLQNI
ncbi:hypothetical protein, conserved [Eimeria maxima]|uniref:Uncharacterized protein n=1 Tax=Eimeria maxima TaxID=5804 RepID=U6LZF7_EIMMA|nr:hypothetical protein, conserved [Eimeria maxima]CDJ57357.1 hypothetical protein, conserved [Eimeria maxima]